MNAELLQILWCVGFALLGWWLRHKGIIAPRPVASCPFAPAWSIDQKTLIELLQALLDRLSQVQSSTSPANPAGPASSIPSKVPAKPRTPSADA